jgi:transposase
MASPLLADDLWALVEPLLRAELPKLNGGRPRVPDRSALTGNLFVPTSGIPWEMPPQGMGWGAGGSAGVDGVTDSRVCELCIRPAGFGRLRTRPAKLHTDPQYDLPCWRQALSRRRIAVRISREGRDASERLGRHRWMVEPPLARLARDRRVPIRCERRADIHEAALTLGCSRICVNHQPLQEEA